MRPQKNLPRKAEATGISLPVCWGWAVVKLRKLQRMNLQRNHLWWIQETPPANPIMPRRKTKPTKPNRIRSLNVAQNLIQNVAVVLESPGVAIDQASQTRQHPVHQNRLPTVIVPATRHQASNEQATMLCQAISSVSILTKRTHRKSFHRQTCLPQRQQLNLLPKRKTPTKHLSLRNRANRIRENSWQNPSRRLDPTTAVA